MKNNLLLLTLLLVVCSLLLSACGKKNSQTLDTQIIESNNNVSINNDNNVSINEQIPPTKSFIVQCLKMVPGIIEYEFVTEETDPNNSLNKPGWYIEKVYFSYVFVNQENVLGETLLEKAVSAGGSIEVYRTVEDAKKRDEYLKTFDGTVLYAGSHIVYNTCVIRTSDELTATQQVFLENNILYALKGENNKIQKLNSAPNDSDVNGHSEGLEFKINDDNESYSLTGIGSCLDKNIRVPDKYKNLPVTQIAKNCFKNNNDILSIEIPGSVTTIMSYSFENCSNLKTVKILNGTKTIAYGAFENCVSLEQIFIPKSVDYIGSSAFYNCLSIYMVNCDDLKSWCQIYFSNDFSNPTYYSEELYINYSPLRKLIIPNDVTKINSYTFRNCTKITSIDIPNTVTEIHEGAFHGCTQLKSKDRGVTYIDQWAIYCDTNLTMTTLREGTIGIAWNTFSNCTLTSIIIPTSLKYINPQPYYNPAKLENIFYKGTADNWNNIINSGTNDYFDSDKVVLFSENKPVLNGMFWHYVNGDPSVWE